MVHAIGIRHSKNQEFRSNWNFGSQFCMPILDVGHQLIFGPMSQLTICQGHWHLEIRNQGNTLKTEPSPKDMQSKIQLSHHLCLEFGASQIYKKTSFFDRKNGIHNSSTKKTCWHCPIPPTWLRLWTAVPPTVLWPFTWQLAPQRWRYDSSSGCMDGIKYI